MKKNACAALLSLLIAAPAFAADKGYYGAIDLEFVGYSNATVPGQGVSYPNPKAIYLAGGSRISPVLAVEAGYSMIGDSTVNFPNASSTTLKTSVLQLAAVGTYALGKQFGVFGKLGMARVSAQESGTGIAAGLAGSASTTGLMFGFGAQYNIDKQYALRAQYENFGKAKMTRSFGGLPQAASDIGLTTFSVGCVYSF